MTSTTLPEGNSVAYTYDAAVNPWANNVASITRNPKPGSPLSPTSSTFVYDTRWNKPTSVTDALGLVSTVHYDDHGNALQTVSDVGASPHFNATNRFTYDSYGRVLTATDPLGTVTSYAYDASENLTSVTADYGRLNIATSYAYDTVGNVISQTDPRGNTSTMTYDAARQLLATTGPPPYNAGALLVRTTNAYDTDGRLISVTRANNGGDQVTSTSYTPTGKVQSVTDPNGNVTTYTYDLDDRLASVRQPASGGPRLTSFTYDALGREATVVDALGNTAEQYSYTPNSKQASFMDANSNVTGYAYDGLDRLSVTTYPDGSTEGLAYDADDNTVSKTTRRKDVIAFSYDTLNRLTAMTPPPGTPTVSYGYDLAGRLISVSSNGPAITNPVPPSGGTVQYATTYAYDQMNRATSVSWNPAPTQSTPTAATVTFTHGYSTANQRISQSVTDNTWLSYPSGASSTTYTANNLNQYTAVGAITPTYDANGNLISADKFDAMPTPTAGTTNYVYDPDKRQVLEYDGSKGTILRWYAYGLGPNEVLNAMDVPGNTRQTLIPDIQGSTIATLSSSTGTLTKRGYLPFGENGTSAGAFAYTGQFLDTSGLYNYRARVYSPALGRFPQPDPIGYAGGRNLYAYVGNDPLNATDRSGLAVDFGRYDFGNGPVQVAGGGVNSRASLPPSFTEGINAGGVQARYQRTLDQVRAINPNYQAPSAIGPPGATRSEGELRLLQQELARQQEVFHYTSGTAVSSIESQGLRPGSYATPSGTLSPLQAQIDLALPPNRGLPEALIRVDLAGLQRAGFSIPPVTQVGRSFGMPGGGFEMKFPYSIPPEFITVIRR